MFGSDLINFLLTASPKYERSPMINSTADQSTQNDDVSPFELLSTSTLRAAQPKLIRLTIPALAPKDRPPTVSSKQVQANFWNRLVASVSSPWISTLQIAQDCL
ncbi:hypothetical protein M758_8G190100 [Ceratodon purpureus]|uniref:Uncharacterized protein n=1 Tax=Ceratodon purpureus TaxID=3225 RepID=A0A8T0H5B1_CERPU|nr:hypothetical protein KC19_8G195100 [Ceratodon purpureus]KAG0609510.1 hypothetical protein M758_8G190100 [Ceratodon purpureus]